MTDRKNYWEIPEEREKIQVYKREYYQRPEIKEKQNARSNAWRKANPEANKSSKLKHKYGITLEEYKEMLKLQNDGCAICGTKEIDYPYFYVDHNHECCPREKSCGFCVRGLLCKHCNFGIGFLKDNPEYLSSALDYIRKYNADLD